MAATAKLIPPPQPATPLQLALQDRTRVSEEIARLTGISARLTSEANGEAFPEGAFWGEGRAYVLAAGTFGHHF
jgi:hypothetical protein